MPRFTLSEEILRRLGRPGSPFAIPPELASPSVVTPPFVGPEQPTPLERLEAQRARLDQPMTRKQALLDAVRQAAPIAVGGLFGGSEGAYGAAQGVEQATAEQGRLREARRKTLAEEIEAQRQRDFQGEQSAQNRT